MILGGQSHVCHSVHIQSRKQSHRLPDLLARSRRCGSSPANANARRQFPEGTKEAMT